MNIYRIIVLIPHESAFGIAHSLIEKRIHFHFHAEHPKTAEFEFTWYSNETMGEVSDEIRRDLNIPAFASIQTRGPLNQDDI